MIYFRLGDDHRGISDLYSALKFYPDNLAAKEKLSLSLRRLGKFDEAMQITSDIIALKEEERRKRQLNDEILRQQELIRATESITTNASMAPSQWMENENDSYDATLREGEHDMQEEHSDAISVNTSLSKPREGHISSGSSVTKSTKHKSGASNVSAVNQAVVSMFQRATKCPVEGNMCLSMQDRVSYLQAYGKKEGDDSATTGAIVAVTLADFKALNGFKSNLSENIFVKPSVLQEALAHPPQSRSLQHIEAIVSDLRLIPLLHGTPVELLQCIARIAEYRTFSTATDILAQDYPANGVGIVLRGAVQVRMDMDESAMAASFQSPNNLILESLHTHTAFGHIDMLFANPQLTKSILEDTRVAEAQIEQMNHDRDTHTSLFHNAENKEVFYNDIVRSKEDDDISFTSGVSVGSLDDPTRSGGASVNVTAVKGTGNNIDTSEEIDNNNCIGGCRPGIFMSYRIMPISEILFIPPEYFLQYLVPAARSELMRRLETIRACRIFSGWAPRSHIQLARMGTMLYYRAGDLILDQGDVPNFIYIVTKGMCKAYKKPNKIDILIRNLNALKQKALDHDCKYNFHHRLRRTMVLANPGHGVPFEKGTGLHTTQLESDRFKLEIEIQKLEKIISDYGKSLEMSNSDASSLAEDDDNDMLSSELEEISVIQWPMLFGEACVIQPDGGISAGRIMADTPCEIFCIHKLQLQTFRIQESFVTAVKDHAIKYPHDGMLVSSMKKKKHWGKFKEEFLTSLYEKSPKKSHFDALNNDHEFPFR